MARQLFSGPPSHNVRSSLRGRLSARNTPLSVRASATLLACRLSLLWLAVLVEIALLLVALVPQSIWADYGYPAGPIPNALSPLVAGVFYLLPTLTGALCRRWQSALLLATLPAWLDLAVFAVAAARRIGPFYLAQDPHTTNTLATLELFAILGLLGWLARCWLIEALGVGSAEERL